jgi:putative oxidoreductase
MVISTRFGDFVVLLARIMMSSSMIYYGCQKLIDISMFTTNFATMRLMQFVANGAPCPLWFAYANAVFQLLAGLMVLFGFKGRWAAGALTLWLIVLTYLGQPFWMMSGYERLFNESMFYRNLGLIAAFAMIFATGCKRYSIDYFLNQNPPINPYNPAD